MKKVAMLVLCGLISPLGFSAEFDVNGFGRVRSEMSDNTDLNADVDDAANFTSYRFQMGIKAAKSKDASGHVFLQPRFNKTAGTGAAGSTIAAEDTVQMHQAYLFHKFNENFFITAGRQEMSYGDQLIVGSVGWSDIGRAFDGFKFSYKSNFGSTDLFSMTVEEEKPYDNHQRDYDFNGVYHSMSAGSVKNLDLYHLVKQDLSQDGAETKNIVNATGIRIKSDMDALDYRVEYTVQSVYQYDATDADYTTESASQYDVELGYSVNKFRVAAEVASASEFYQQLYPTGHKWMGFTDFFTRQNISQTAVHFGYKHDDNTKLTLSYHMFSVAKTESNTNYDGGIAAADDEKELGNEIDLVIIHKLSDDLTMLIKHAAFTPGKHYKDANLDAAASKTWLQLMTKF